MTLVAARRAILGHAHDDDIEEAGPMHMALEAREWTVDDLASLPDDGNRYEIIGGELIVSPSPSWDHQRAVLQLALLLVPYVKAYGIGEVIIAPADVVFSARDVVEPDLFVVPLFDGRRPRKLEPGAKLPLAVEVLSPSSARTDRVRKRTLYRAYEVGEYWVVDLEARIIERSTPTDDHVVPIDAMLRWSPAGASEPLAVDVLRYFRDVLD